MNTDFSVVLQAEHEQDMQGLAARLAAIVRPPLTIHLVGPLGAGKTVFARAFIQALGHPGRVKSPTYALLEQYPAQFGDVDGQVLHVDLYRLVDPEELEFVGLADLLDETTVLLVEWPEQGGAFVPPPDLVVRLADDPYDDAPERRTVILETMHSERANRLSAALSTFSS